jgi:hypothetical protein
METAETRDAAFDFMKAIGLDATPDAISQLAGPFSEALRVMCTRGYDREGLTWKRRGWRDLVYKIMDKTNRLKFHSWFHSHFDGDSSIDLINFSGFYWRMENEGLPWGETGAPE